MTAPPRHVLCVGNEGHHVSLVVRRVYLALPDDDAERNGMFRVVDESGEDHLFPMPLFVGIELSPAASACFHDVASDVEAPATADMHRRPTFATWRDATPEEVAACTSLVIGQRLATVEAQDGTWFFRFSDDFNVLTEGPWRLIRESRIEVTSEDDGQWFGLNKPTQASPIVQSATRDLPVTAARVSPREGDLTICFGSSVELQFLQLSCGYESWRVDAQGTELCCGGGGTVNIIPASDPATNERGSLPGPALP